MDQLVEIRIGLNAKNGEGKTFINMACRESYVEVINQLVRTRAFYSNIKTNTGSTSLHLECLKGHVEEVNELVAIEDVD
jgi:ankyrin repeat protein